MIAVITLPFSPVLLVYVAMMKMGSWIIPLVTSYLPHDPHGADEISQTRAFRGIVSHDSIDVPRSFSIET